MMNSCVALVSKLTVAVYVLMHLCGCAVTTEVHVLMDELVVDGENVSFVINRAKNEVTKGADYYAAKTISARSELYDFKLNFDANEIAVLPVMSEDAAEWTPEGVHEPLPTKVVFTVATKKIMHAFDRNMQINKQAIPTNGIGVNWLRSGRHAYAYMSTNGTLTHIKESGESCDIKALKGFPDVTPLLSGSGLYAAIAERAWDIDAVREEDTTISIYEECQKLAVHRLRMKPQDRVRDVCRSGEFYWFAIVDSETRNMSAFNSFADLSFQLPSNVYDDKFLYQEPRFDCLVGRFIWFSVPAKQQSDRTQVYLHQYDPKKKKKTTVLLLLGDSM